MNVKRVGSQPSAKGPSDWFTGNVRIDPTGTRSGAGSGRRRHLEAKCSDGLACASARSDTRCHRGLWLGSASRWPS